MAKKTRSSMKEFLHIILVLAVAVFISSCDRSEDNFTVVDGNEYYSEDSNIETLLREINPQEEILHFSYKNDQVQPYDQQLDLGAFTDRILFELTPLSFEDRFGDVYRGKVEVYIEYANKSKDYLRRGFNTQYEDMSLLQFDFALRMIFTDDKGYRLNLREPGLEISLISTGDFIAEDIFTLKDPDSGWPYIWKDHPLKDEFNASTTIVTEGGNEFIQYDFIMKDNQWVAFGKMSESEYREELCVEINNSEETLADEEKTMAFAVVNNTSGVEIVQFRFDEGSSSFCTVTYPKEQISRIVICSMSNYVDYFYHESFFQDKSSENIVIQHDEVELETLIESLSSI